MGPTHTAGGMLADPSPDPCAPPMVKKGHAIARPDSAQCFVSKLSHSVRLSEESESLIGRLNVTEEYGPGQTLRGSGRALRPLILAEGWIARYRLLTNGGRQIVALLLPGDHLGVGSVSQLEVEMPMVTVTRVKLLNAAPINEALAQADPAHANLRSAIRTADLQTHERLVNGLVRMGRQNGFERSASLIGELETRLAAVGLAHGGTFAMPLSQEHLADILGMSVVHVSRTFQHLRGEKLITFRGGVVRIVKGALLASIGDYEQHSSA